MLRSHLKVGNGSDLGDGSDLRDAGYRLKKKAVERGWEGTQTSPILCSYVQDAPRPGRLTVCTPERMNGLDAYIESNDDDANHQSLEKLSFSVGNFSNDYTKCKI